MSALDEPDPTDHRMDPWDPRFTKPPGLAEWGQREVPIVTPSLRVMLHDLDATGRILLAVSSLLILGGLIALGYTVSLAFRG